MRSLSLRAHAKINLGLQVLGLRPDGYHELRTRFQSIDLADDLEFHQEPKGLVLEVEGAQLPADSSNLVLRAAAALSVGRNPPGARLLLKKRIPLAAGLGGGSSDAAVTLLGLNVLWDLNLPIENLAMLASGLGADVGYFLVGGAGLGSGRGEVIEPLPDGPDCRIALVLPSLACSTAEIYRGWDQAHPGKKWPAHPAGTDPPARDLGTPEPWADVRNDLEEIVLEMHPELAEYRNALLRAGAKAAALSGSGPTLYGIFSTSREIELLRESRALAGARILDCAPLGRQAYWAGMGLPLSD